jgi:hypothetical protein
MAYGAVFSDPGVAFYDDTRFYDGSFTDADSLVDIYGFPVNELDSRLYMSQDDVQPFLFFSLFFCNELFNAHFTFINHSIRPPYTKGFKSA